MRNVGVLGHVFRSALGDDLAARTAGFGTQVDDPVGRFDDVEIVFDHDDGVAQIDQPIEHVEQLANIIKMQSSCRLIENVNGLAGVGTRQLGGQLDALGLAAGQRRSGLAQSEIAEAHVFQRLQHAANLGDVREQFESLVNPHVQHVGDVLSLELHGQSFRRIPATLADVARDPDVGQEVHFDLPLAVSLASLTTTAGDVEAEPLGPIASEPRLRQLGEELANQIKHSGVRGRVRAGRVAERILIDVDDLVDVFQTHDVVMGPDGDLGPMQLASQGAVKNLVHQGAFARAADARYDDESAERESNVEILEVVLPGALDKQHRRAEPRKGPEDGSQARSPAPHGARLAPPGRRHRNRLLAAEILPCQRSFRTQHLLRRSLCCDFAALIAGAGAEVQQVVGRTDHIAVVFHQDQRVAQVTQVMQGFEEPEIVAWMQADGRFVENVEDAGQPLPIWLARRIRCDSPPESVGVARLRLR